MRRRIGGEEWGLLGGRLTVGVSLNSCGSRGNGTHALVCDDCFAVGAFDGEGFFAWVSVGCCEGEGGAGGGGVEDFFVGEANEGLGVGKHDPIYGHRGRLFVAFGGLLENVGCEMDL